MQKNSVNKVFLIGHLGGSPEARYTKNGRPVASFSVATNERWTQKGGSAVKHTEWHSIVVWDKLAEFSQEHLYKGQLVSVEGRIHTRTWENQDKNLIKTTEIIASNVTPLEWKKEKKN